jgi:hypothetical protein
MGSRSAPQPAPAPAAPAPQFSSVGNVPKDQPVNERQRARRPADATNAASLLTGDKTVDPMGSTGSASSSMLG